MANAKLEGYREEISERAGKLTPHVTSFSSLQDA
jgi:hypothetical protein